MCGDSTILCTSWLLAALVTFVGMIIGVRSFYVDGRYSILARRLSLIPALGVMAPFVVGLARGIRAAIQASAEPLGLHGIDLVWVLIGRSRSMNSLSVLLSVAGALLLLLISGRAAREQRSRHIVVGVVVATSGLLNLVIGREHDELCEAIVLVREIQIAQEAYRAEFGVYANVSGALAANQASNHQALYPTSPHEPGSYFRRWNVPCPAPVCNAGLDWSVLPVHVSGPVKFGYSTIAGRAGERPAANININGRPVQWPVPEKDWYIVTAVGDPTSAREFVTVVGSSLTTQVLIDIGSK